MVFIVLTLVFLLMRVAPGDPITAALGGRVPQEEVDRIKEELGFDRPLYVQYGDYLGDIARATSASRSPTAARSASIIRVNGAATLELTFFAMIVAIVVGVVVRASRRPLPGLVDRRRRRALFGIVIYATPVFFLGLMAQLFFGSYLGWLPTLRPREPDRRRRRSRRTRTSTSSTRSSTRDWDAFVDVVKHLDPAGRHARPRHGGRLHPARPRQRDPDDEGRLHRGRAGARDRRALGRLPPRVQERPRPGDHGRRADRSRCCSPGAVLTETTFNWPGHRRDADRVPPEPRLLGGAGDHHRLRARRRGRQRGHRLRQRVHRPEDPVLMATRCRRSSGRLGRPAARRRSARVRADRARRAG